MDTVRLPYHHESAQRENSHQIVAFWNQIFGSSLSECRMSIRVSLRVNNSISKTLLFLCVFCFPLGRVGETVCLGDEYSCNRQDVACRRTSVTNPFYIR